MPVGGGFFPSAACTSVIRLRRPRAPRSAVIMIICCWFSRSSSDGASIGVKWTSDAAGMGVWRPGARTGIAPSRSEEHTSELQSQSNLVCRLLLEKKKQQNTCAAPFRRGEFSLVSGGGHSGSCAVGARRSAMLSPCGRYLPPSGSHRRDLLDDRHV